MAGGCYFPKPFPPFPFCRMKIPFAATLAAFGLSVLAVGSRLQAADRVSFNRDIRPIFSDTCFQCHGPDEKKREAGLRLDLREKAVKPPNRARPRSFRASPKRANW